MTGFFSLANREIYRFFRVWSQTLLPSIINAALYVLIFGVFIGKRVGEVGGLEYTAFLIPGLVIMNIITTSFGGTSFSIFFAKWEKYIDDLLTSPMSYTQIVLATLYGGAIVRSLFVGGGVFAVLALFGGAQMMHPLIVLVVLVLTSVAFGSLGLIVGLWADRFDHFSIIQTFLITPLIYLGGVFYSIDTLPPLFQTVSKFNPLLYMINAFRYGMVGVSDTDMGVNYFVMTAVALLLFGASVALFRTGYKLRD